MSFPCLGPWLGPTWRFITSLSTFSLSIGYQYGNHSFIDSDTFSWAYLFLTHCPKWSKLISVTSKLVAVLSTVNKLQAASCISLYHTVSSNYFLSFNFWKLRHQRFCAKETSGSRPWLHRSLLNLTIPPWFFPEEWGGLGSRQDQQSIFNSGTAGQAPAFLGSIFSVKFDSHQSCWLGSFPVSSSGIRWDMHAWGEGVRNPMYASPWWKRSQAVSDHSP